MESTEKCEAVIAHFNGKFIKTPAGVSGMLHIFLVRCMNGLLLTWWKPVTLIVVSGFSFRGGLLKLNCVFLDGLLGTQYIAFLL